MNNKFTLPNNCNFILEYNGNVNSLKVLCTILSEAINRNTENVLSIPYYTFKQISTRFKKNGNLYIQSIITECINCLHVKRIISNCIYNETSVDIYFHDIINTFSGNDCTNFFFVNLSDILYLKTLDAIKIYILCKRNTIYGNYFKNTDFVRWLGDKKHEKSLFRTVNNSIGMIHKLGLNIEIHKRKDYWYIEKLQEKTVNDIGDIDLNDDEDDI